MKLCFRRTVASHRIFRELTRTSNPSNAKYVIALKDYNTVRMVAWLRILLFASNIHAFQAARAILVLRGVNSQIINQIQGIHDDLIKRDARFANFVVPISSLYIWLAHFNITSTTLQRALVAFDHLPIYSICLGLKDLRLNGSETYNEGNLMCGTTTPSTEARLRFIRYAAAAVFEWHGFPLQTADAAYDPDIYTVELDYDHDDLAAQLSRFDTGGRPEGPLSFRTLDLMWREQDDTPPFSIIATRELGIC